jgi:uncharacterized membrane protein YkvI
MSNGMYTKLTHMEIPYGEIIYIYRKAHVIVMQVIFRLEITKLSYIGNVMFWHSLHIVLIKSNKWVDIRYNMIYMNYLSDQRVGELEKNIPYIFK